MSHDCFTGRCRSSQKCGQTIQSPPIVSFTAGGQNSITIRYSQHVLLGATPDSCDSSLGSPQGPYEARSSRVDCIDVSVKMTPTACCDARFDINSDDRELA